MRRTFAILLAFVMLASAGSMVSAEVGWDNPLAVFIVAPEGDWDVGTEMNITVLVFNEGDPYDPDDVNITVGYDYRELTLERYDTGVYYVEYTVLASDMDYDDELVFEANAIDGIGPTADMAVDWLGMYPGSGSGTEFWFMLVPLSPGAEEPRAGDTVEFGIWLYYGSDLVDPDPGTLVVTVYDDDMDEVASTVEKVKTGQYTASFQVPSGAEPGDGFYIEAEAEYTDGGGTEIYSDSYGVIVKGMDVWVRFVDVSTSKADIEIWLTDADGMGLVGVDLLLTYSYFNDEWDYVSRDIETETDTDGNAPFTLSYPDLDEDEYYVEAELSFEVGEEGYMYYLEVQVREDGGSGGWGFEVSPEAMFVPADEHVTIDYVATYDGSPIVAQDIMVYLTNDYGVFFNGKLRTNAAGEFQVSFDSPPAGGGFEGMNFLDASFQYHRAVGWEVTSGYIMVGPDMPMSDDIRDYLDAGTTISVEPFEAGGTAQVTITSTGATGVDEMAMVLVVAGSLDDYAESTPPEFGHLTDWEVMAELFSAVCTWSDGAYHAEVPIPSIIPTDLDLTFIGVVSEGSIWTGNIKIAYLEGLNAMASNEPPTVTVTTPVDGEQFSGVLLVEGTSSDDSGVERVEYRIDGGVWKEVEGTSEWTLELDTSTLESGTHQLEVRAWDGEEWSTVTKSVFESDQPPELEMTTQISNMSLHGIWAFVGLASDDNEVDRVEFSVDAGSWFRAEGTEEWSFELDTSMFTSSEHVLKVRASDGERFSLELEFNFSINQLPIVSVSGHVEGKLYKDKVEFEGTASDDIAVVSIEVRVDGGEWFDIGAELSWRYKVDTDGLGKGNHTFEVRVWDGEKYSEVYSTSFNYEESESPGFGLLAALLASMAAVPLARWRMGRER